MGAEEGRYKMEEAEGKNKKGIRERRQMIR
jgi:hypothetical protein